MMRQLDFASVVQALMRNINEAVCPSRMDFLHRKDYTKIICLNYAGSLRQTIANMVIVDDLASEPEDAFLGDMLQYRCSILFTPRCRYEDHTTMELEELSDEALAARLLDKGIIRPRGLPAKLRKTTADPAGVYIGRFEERNRSGCASGANGKPLYNTLIPQ